MLLYVVGAGLKGCFLQLQLYHGLPVMRESILFTGYDHKTDFGSRMEGRGGLHFYLIPKYCFAGLSVSDLPERFLRIGRGIEKKFERKLLR